MDELLNNAPCGFLTFADNGEIVEANATLLELLGYRREEFCELHMEKIFPVAGRIFYQTHFFPLLKLHSKAEEVYLSLRARTGDDIPVLVNARRSEREGKIVNDCVFVPIRQRDEYENEILRAKKEAEAATRSKDEFLSIVSHELRTPLNAILGWTQMLQSGTLDAEMIQRGIETIGRNARAQTKLIEDILDYTRIISGNLRFEISPVDLSKVIEAALEITAPAACAKDIRLESTLEPDVFVSGDAARLQQVLWNLLLNAIKFSPKGTSVEVRLRSLESSVEISVRDEGKGISAEFLPHVFERFRQADNSQTRRHGGLGLGLSIVRHIVELHGGTVRAESPGEDLGSTFTVSLPLSIPCE